MWKTYCWMRWTMITAGKRRSPNPIKIGDQDDITPNDKEEAIPLFTQPQEVLGVSLGGAVTALRGMMDTAIENVATACATLEEAAAVFNGEVDDEEEAEAAELAGVGYESDDEEEHEIPHQTTADPPHPDGPPIDMVVDADNGFNNQNQMAMVWTVRHRWPSMALFTMNMYRHWVRLIVREPGGDPCIILSKEGIVQDASKAMFHNACSLVIEK